MTRQVLKNSRRARTHSLAKNFILNLVEMGSARAWHRPVFDGCRLCRSFMWVSAGFISADLHGWLYPMSAFSGFVMIKIDARVCVWLMSTWVHPEVPGVSNCQVGMVFT